MIIRPLTIMILTLLFALIAVSAQASEKAQFDLKEFSKIPIMHDGRIKPMDSYARSMKKQISGSESNAVLWLVNIIFNPAYGEKTPILHISNPDLINLLAIEKHPNKLYTYQEISNALAKQQEIVLSIIDKPPENWTRAQSDLIILQQRTVLFADLLSSLSLYLPLSISIPSEAPAELSAYADKTLSYVDALTFRKALNGTLNDIINDKGQDVEIYTETEQHIAYLSYTLSSLEKTGRNSRAFSVIPSTDPSQSWASLWNNILSNETSNAHTLWQDLSDAYHTKNIELWNESVQKLYAYSQSTKVFRKNAVELEYIYNKLSPFYVSMILYVISFLTLLSLNASILHENKYIQRITASMLLAGIIVHSSGILARIYILERPPVSTLYESIIFVGLISVIYSFWVYTRNKENIWLYISALSGISLHILGLSQDQSGDNFLMLTAVLNTNFWLTTHVICITVGYAFCILTSMLAHYALLQRACCDHEQSAKLYKHTHGLALLSLLFTAVGTVLGGIWADQSWGRFWGWDPKENGALLIVLWIIWIIHGRISGQFKETATLVGFAYLSVIVALSWFGVNLLSVGLHAYGFTDSAGWSLSIFFILETALISMLWYRTRYTKTT